MTEVPTTWSGLCVRQPWADALLDPNPAAKRIENRKGTAIGWKHRGPLVIIAPKFWAADPWVFADERLRTIWPDDGCGAIHKAQRSRGYALAHVPAYGKRPPHPFVASAALGIVDLVDIHPAAGCCHPWGEDSYTDADGPVTNVVHLVTENPRRFPEPIRNVDGFLGIRRLDPELADAIEAAAR